jgi:hypothetical protein
MYYYSLQIKKWDLKKKEGTILLLLFNCRCLVTTGCCGSTILTLREYAAV